MGAGFDATALPLLPAANTGKLVIIDVGIPSQNLHMFRFGKGLIWGRDQMKTCSAATTRTGRGARCERPVIWEAVVNHLRLTRSLLSLLGQLSFV